LAKQSNVNHSGYDELPRQPTKALWPYLMVAMAIYLLALVTLYPSAPRPASASLQPQQLPWTAAELSVSDMGLGLPYPLAVKKMRMQPKAKVLTGPGNRVWAIEGPELKTPAGTFQAGQPLRTVRDNFPVAPAAQSNSDCLVWRGQRFVLKVWLAGEAISRFELLESLH